MSGPRPGRSRHTGRDVRNLDSMETSLRLFDGKHTDLLERIFIEMMLVDGMLDRLILLAEGGATAPGAMWMLRRAHRQGFAFTPAQSERIIRLLLAEPPWPSMLVLLQMLGAMTVGPAQREALLAMLYRTASHANAFIRAWSLSGLVLVGGTMPRHARRIAGLAAQAEKSGSPAVRARIRLARRQIAQRDA